MNNNNWLDIDVLEAYLDGKLDAKAMHRVERLSLEDPFVAEALAGLSLSPKRVQSLSLLQKQLQDRVAQKPVEQKRWQITSQRLSIAAAAAVLFVTVSLLFWMRESNNRAQVAANSSKKVDVAIAATQAPEKPKAEVEKIIAEAKSNTYASRAKKVSPQAILQSPAEALAPVLENPKVEADKIITEAASRSRKEESVKAKAKDDAQALSEVVIVGYGAQKKQAITGSVSRIAISTYEPVGGWGKFEQYVIDNNKLLKDKKLTGRYVTVSFKVNENGEPTDMKVTKNANMLPQQTEAEEKEAIRLVKEGPKWVLPPSKSSSSREITVNINF